MQLGIRPRGSRRGRLRRRLCRLHQTRILKRSPAQTPDASKRIPREEIRARIWSSARVSHLAPTFSNHSRAPRQTHKPEQKYKGGNHGRPPAQNLPICGRRHPHRTTLRRLGSCSRRHSRQNRNCTRLNSCTRELGAGKRCVPRRNRNRDLPFGPTPTHPPLSTDNCHRRCNRTKPIRSDHHHTHR